MIRGRGIRGGPLMAAALALLTLATPALAEVDWGIGLHAGGLAGGRLYKASAGQSREWITPARTISYFGEELTTEIDAFVLGGVRATVESDRNWGVVGQISLTDVDVTGILRTGTDKFNNVQWDQYFVVNAQLVGTWAFVADAASTPYVLVGTGFSDLASEGSAANQGGVHFVFGGGWRFRLPSGWFDLEVRDTVLPLDFDDEEARLRERPLPDGGFDPEDRVHLLEVTASWVFRF